MTMLSSRTPVRTSLWNAESKVEGGQYATIQTNVTMPQDNEDGSLFDRRSVLKATGGLAALGAGGYALTGSAAATSDVDISSTGPVKAETVDGEISRVFIEPEITVNWSGFDEVVSRARILVEADVGNGYQPVFRTTPWFDGTSDEGQENGGVTLGQDVFSPRGAYDDYADGHRFPIVLANDQGLPDYATVAANSSGSVTEQTYVEGTSLGEPAESAVDGEGLVNHTYRKSDGWNFGYYGAAGDINTFYSMIDGETAPTGVNLRYVVTLHTDGQYTPLAMYDEYEGYIAKSGTSMEVKSHSIPHSVLAESGGHPAVMVSESNFQVKVTNEQATAGASGNSNPGVDE
jgi:hypothetical protein